MRECVRLTFVMNTVSHVYDLLPTALKKEAEDFILFIWQKYNQQKSDEASKLPQLKWAGALRELKKQVSSVQLQHDLLDTRISSYVSSGH